MESTVCQNNMPSFGYAVSRTVLYIILLIIVVASVSFLFGWSTVEAMPIILLPYSSFLLSVNPYLNYIDAVIVFGLGYLTVNAASGMVYTYVRRVSEHATAATLKTMTKIIGIAVLLAVLASIFNVNPAAALTVGSFGGLVVGLGAQTILTHVVAGIFLLISRPFTYGDTITVAGHTGVVKEIKLLHIAIETLDSQHDVLIPSGTIVSQIVLKKLPKVSLKPLRTAIQLDTVSSTLVKGQEVVFTGRLIEQETGKPLGQRTIGIYDQDVGRDDLLAEGVTNADGTFSIAWKARKVDLIGQTGEICAKFGGDGKYACGKSETCSVTIQK